MKQTKDILEAEESVVEAVAQFHSLRSGNDAAKLTSVM